MTKSSRKIWPVGSVVLQLGTPEKYYIINRDVLSQSFQYKSVSGPANSKLFLTESFPPLTRSYCLQGLYLPDFFDKKNVSIVSGRSISFNGKDVVEIVARVSEPPLHRDYRFTFARPDWRMLTFDLGKIAPGEMLAHSKVVYDESVSPIAIKSCEDWTRLCLKTRFSSCVESWPVAAWPGSLRPVSRRGFRCDGIP